VPHPDLGVFLGVFGVLRLLDREVVVDHLVGRKPHVAGVFAQEPLGEDGGRQEVEAIGLHGLQVAQADLGPLGDVAQADLAHLALPAEPVSEGTAFGRHGFLLPGRLTGRTLTAGYASRLRLGEAGRFRIAGRNSRSS
jgi:hypothetical protein